MEYIGIFFKYLGYALNWQPFGMHGVNNPLSIRGLHILVIVGCIYGIYKIINNERNSKMDEITLEQFEEFENVRQSGQFNMFDPNARRVTSLTKSEWLCIMENYQTLMDKFDELKNVMIDIKMDRL